VVNLGVVSIHSSNVGRYLVSQKPDKGRWDLSVIVSPLGSYDSPLDST
jgi:hypothetical protein